MDKRILVVGILFLLILLASYVFFVPNESPVVPSEEPIETEQGQQAVENPAPGERTIRLFYYNPSLDQDASGNVMCTTAGLVPVSRSIASATPIEETLRLLLTGNLSAEERAQGITTEYPLAGVSLSSVALGEDGETQDCPQRP